MLLFGGTSEGRMLAQWLSNEGIAHLVCVATEYGGELLEKGVCARVGRLSKAEMTELMREGFSCVVDATHPYARVVTETIIDAALEAGLPRLRLLRDGDVSEGAWLSACDTQEAAEMLKTLDGNILLTTGSKEVHLFSEHAKRLYPRVLPSIDSLEKCAAAAVPSKQIICMQGPFTREMNEATIKQFDIKIMVTKATGALGGFWEKIKAAEATGCSVLVIGRPLRESGFSIEEIKQKLLKDVYS